MLQTNTIPFCRFILIFLRTNRIEKGLRSRLFMTSPERTSRMYRQRSQAMSATSLNMSGIEEAVTLRISITLGYLLILVLKSLRLMVPYQLGEVKRSWLGKWRESAKIWLLRNTSLVNVLEVKTTVEAQCWTMVRSPLMSIHWVGLKSFSIPQSSWNTLPFLMETILTCLPMRVVNSPLLSILITLPLTVSSCLPLMSQRIPSDSTQLGGTNSDYEEQLTFDLLGISWLAFAELLEPRGLFRRGSNDSDLEGEGVSWLLSGWEGLTLGSAEWSSYRICNFCWQRLIMERVVHIYSSRESRGCSQLTSQSAMTLWRKMAMKRRREETVLIIFWEGYICLWDNVRVIQIFERF